MFTPQNFAKLTIASSSGDDAEYSVFSISDYGRLVKETVLK
jgi:hypothetical protein